MASPSLVVVPPSPVDPLAVRANGTRPSPTTTASYTTAPPTPDLPPIDIPGFARKSSETDADGDINRIFSMYGDVGSWSAGSPDDPSLLDDQLSPSMLSPLSNRQSLFQPYHPEKRISLGNGPAHPAQPLPVIADTQLRTPRPFMAGMRQPSTESYRDSGPVYTLEDDDEPRPRLSQSGMPTPRSRPPSSFRPESQIRPNSQHPPSLPNGQPTSRLSTHHTSRPHSPGSRRSSQHPASPRPDVDDPQQIPLPPSAPPSRATTPGKLELLSPQPASSPRLRTPSQNTTASSALSLVPSEGEDSESFFVRSTYAQLDVSGVKGDGYEEGVERTRARVGGSRASALRAQNAVADGSEKHQDLTAEEMRLLGSLDRYGFFTPAAHERLVLLPGVPLQKPLARMAAGATSGPTNATSVPKLTPPARPTREASRISKWDRMMKPGARDRGGNVDTWTVAPSKEHKLRERVYKGIPDRWRRAAWDVLMSRFARTDPKAMEHLRQAYRDGLEKPSTYDIQIDLDVPRTISGHVMFRTRYGLGQRSLFHVLHSFSLRCSTCGYVQGMGPIAATLLCYLDPENVYASLVRLHDAYDMHSIFAPGFPGLLESIYVQERVTEEMMPAVYAAFKKHMVSSLSYATKWYITLFANSVPFQTQLRLWDAFLLEGQDVFVVIALAIIWAYRDHITTSGATFETILSLLSSFFVPEDEDALILWIGKVLGDAKLRASMKNWRAEWKGLVASGKSDTALL